MSEPRKPAAFRVEPVAPPPSERPTAIRKPVSVAPAEVEVVPDLVDAFEAEIVPETPPPPPRRGIAGRVLAAALAILVSLALGLWTDALLRELFDRATWLGWFATAVAAIGAIALLVLVGREFLAVSRLASMERLRASAAEAILLDDAKRARAVVGDLVTLVGSQPLTAAGRARLAETRDEIIDGAGLIRLAELEVVAPLDLQAQALILGAAKRVSVVTAVSPRAVVDLAYVAFETARLIRRIAALYGARPGVLGFYRLLRSVVAHLAVTGVVAAGDDFVHQVLGQGLAARLSTKLGEGVVNGMMTARVGVAAMQAARPLPFAASRPPRLADFVAALSPLKKRDP